MAISRIILRSFPDCAAAGLVYCQLLMVVFFFLFVHHVKLGLAYETDSHIDGKNPNDFHLMFNFFLFAQVGRLISTDDMRSRFFFFLFGSMYYTVRTIY